MFTILLKRFLKEKSGQALTEYGAILGFVACLVGLAFSVAAPYRESLLACYAFILAQLTALNNLQ